MEDLVALSAKVEGAWRAAFWDTNHINDSALNVDVASESPKPEVCVDNSIVIERKSDE